MSIEVRTKNINSKTVTNREKLFAMSDEELAQAIVYDKEGNEQASCAICASVDDCDDNCYGGVLKWLQMEAE